MNNTETVFISVSPSCQYTDHAMSGMYITLICR